MAGERLIEKIDGGARSQAVNRRGPVRTVLLAPARVDGDVKKKRRWYVR